MVVGKAGSPGGSGEGGLTQTTWAGKDDLAPRFYICERILRTVPIRAHSLSHLRSPVISELSLRGGAAPLSSYLGEGAGRRPEGQSDL